MLFNWLQYWAPNYPHRGVYPHLAHSLPGAAGWPWPARSATRPRAHPSRTWPTCSGHPRSAGWSLRLVEARALQPWSAACVVILRSSSCTCVCLWLALLVSTSSMPCRGIAHSLAQCTRTCTTCTLYKDMCECTQRPWVYTGLCCGKRCSCSTWRQQTADKQHSMCPTKKGSLSAEVEGNASLLVSAFLLCVLVPHTRTHIWYANPTHAHAHLIR